MRCMEIYIEHIKRRSVIKLRRITMELLNNVLGICLSLIFAGLASVLIFLIVGLCKAIMEDL